MQETNVKELNESIELLSNYHDRLKQELINIGKKLQMTPKKIDSTIGNNSELNEVKKTINKLTVFLNKYPEKNKSNQ